MRYAKIPGGLALTFMCLSSCQSRFPSSPESAYPVELRTEQVQRAIIARQGEFTALAIDFTACDSSARAVSGAPVTLRVLEGPGEVAPEIAVSDSFGRVRAVFFALVVQAEAHARILASVPNDSLIFDIAILGQPAPARLDFVSPPAVLNIRPGSPSTFQLQARAYDAEGSALVNQQIRFRVISGAASVEHVTSPDSEGIVASDFRHLGYDFTSLRITAETVSPFDLQQLPAALASSKVVRRLASAGSSEVFAGLSLPVKPLRALQLSFLPSNTLEYKAGTPIRVAVQAKYEAGEAAPGVKIRLESNPPGSIASSALITGSNGIAATTINPARDAKSVSIIASAPDFGVTATTVIDAFDPASIQVHVKRLQSNPLTIEIQLQDKNGRDLVRFPTRVRLGGKESRIALTGADGRVVHRLEPAPGNSDSLSIEVRPEGDHGEWLKFDVELPPEVR